MKKLTKKPLPLADKPEKSLISILKKHSGRDSSGRIVVRHQGGRQKRYYRHIDFKRNKIGIEGIVQRFEYDPNRNAHIALIKYADGEMRYILHPKDLQIGDSIMAQEKTELKVGNAMPLKNIPVGVSVHNVEMRPKQGGVMVRGAGTSAMIMAQEERYTQIKMPSGEVRRVLCNCWATIGRVGNVNQKFEQIGKAGRNILMGRRPTVRGVAQNPRSHPHGGGEGRTGEGMHPKTPTGKKARGVRTRKKHKQSNGLIIQRRKK